MKKPKKYLTLSQLKQRDIAHYILLFFIVAITVVNLCRLKDKERVYIVQECSVSYFKPIFDPRIAGYKVQVNDCIKFVRTKKQAIEAIKRLQEYLDSYPENLEYMGWDVIWYDEY